MKINDSLELKPIVSENSAQIFNIIDSQREYLGQWLPFVSVTHKVEDTEAAMKKIQESGNPQFGIYYKNEFAGIVGFKDKDVVNNKIEIGYWLSENMQGKGIMTQTVLKLLEYAFGKMAMNRVHIKAAIENQKSRAIPERLGFVEEGTEREGAIMPDKTYTGLVIYSLLKKEFEEQKHKLCK